MVEAKLQRRDCKIAEARICFVAGVGGGGVGQAQRTRGLLALMPRGDPLIASEARVGTAARHVLNRKVRGWGVGIGVDAKLGVVRNRALPGQEPALEPPARGAEVD